MRRKSRRVASIASLQPHAVQQFLYHAVKTNLETITSAVRVTAIGCAHHALNLSSVLDPIPLSSSLRVVAQNLSAANGYVQAVTLNGKPITRAFLRHEELMEGGELRFVMSPKAQACWSMESLELPYSMTAG